MSGSRGARVVASALVVAVLAAACSETAPVATSPQAEPVAAVTNLVPAPTLNRSIDRDLIAACIDRVQFGAYAQDPELVAMWTEAGRDVDGLRRLCETLGIDDPAALQALADEWDEVQRTLESQPGSTTTTVATSGTPAPRTTTPAGRPAATNPTTGPTTGPATATTSTVATDATPPPAAPTCAPGEVAGPDGSCIPAVTDPPAPTAPPAPPPPAPPSAPAPTA